VARRLKSLDELRRPAPKAGDDAQSMVPRTACILGIDPGSRYTGWGVVACEGRKTRHIASGRISAAEGDMGARLMTIFAGLQAVVAAYAPTEIAIEETFVNRSNAQSALVLGQARGVALLAAAQCGARVAEYATASVKLAVAGHGRADKQQIAHMVRLLLKLGDALSPDAADALAVALCHAQVRGSALGGWG
jgi:crossover junction endodeoxyribonuclease RuvC